MLCVFKSVDMNKVKNSEKTKVVKRQIDRPKNRNTKEQIEKGNNRHIYSKTKDTDKHIDKRPDRQGTK
jgi:hypothetical protein